MNKTLSIQKTFLSFTSCVALMLASPAIAKTVSGDIINAKDFGAIPDDNKDDTKAIQSALDFAAQKIGQRRVRAGTVHLDGGYYNIDRLILPSYVKLKGAGVRATFLGANRFKPKPVFDNDPEYGMIEIAAGPVQNSGISDMTLFGNTQYGGNLKPNNSKQWAIYLRAKWDKKINQGGLWWSDFENLNIEGFNHLLWSRGGYSTRHSLLPNQFNTYKNINAASTGRSGDAVRFTGQHGQQMLDSTAFNAHSGGNNYKNSKLRLLYIGTDPEPVPVMPKFGENKSDKANGRGNTRAPGDMMIKMPTLQGAKHGLYVEHAGPISLIGGHLEALQNSVHAFGNAKVSLQGGMFANAGDGGSIFTVQSGGQLTGHGNTITGRYNHIAKTHKPWKFQLSDSLINGDNGIASLKLYGKYLNVDGREEAVLTQGKSLAFIQNAPDRFKLHINHKLILLNYGNLELPKAIVVNKGDTLSFTRVGQKYRVVRASL